MQKDDDNSSKRGQAFNLAVEREKAKTLKATSPNEQHWS
jgi:hypothetical protein